MRSQEIRSIGEHLTAANLFGGQPEKQLQAPTTKPLPGTEVVTAIYPAIINDAFAQTMENYRQYVAEYNFRTEWENEVIARHNMAVQIYKKNNQLTDIEQQYLRFFPQRYGALTAREYNQEVDAAGEKLGVLLTKKRIQTIKPVTEQFFSNFLHMYNGQLMYRNEQYMRFHVRTPRPIQEMDINAHFITQLKRNGVTSLAVCSKTVRNHRTRLQEAGVLTDYSFHGRTNGVRVHVNPQILAVLDLQTNKIVTAENQRVTSDLGKELPEHYQTTGAFKKQYKKSEAASHASCDKELPNGNASLHYMNVSTMNTGGKQRNSPGGGAPASVKIEKTLSEILREKIIHPQALAEGLASGTYDNYNPLSMSDLYKEAYKGTLTREEYRELVIQDFFKNAAKLYRDSTPYAGSWKNAINTWMNLKFITVLNNKTIHYNKHHLFDHIEQLRWRLENSRKWFLRTGIKTLYPSNYFDPTRKTAKEIGFEYTKKAWERHLKYLAEQPAKKLKREKAAQIRLSQVNHAKKFENKIRAFLKNKIDLPQLIDYVQNNLPAEFSRALPKKLQQIQATFKL